MEVDPTSPGSSQPYTILRIKRKRNEEPLDALVTESSLRRKKRGGLDVFQFAETVEPEAWVDRAKDLQDRISAREREQALKVATQPGHDDTPPPNLKRPDPSRQYKVVVDDKPATPSPTTSRSLSSAILSAKDEVDNVNLEYKVYDAVLTSDASSPVDPEMEKFLPLLEEYLTLHDIKSHALPAVDSVGSLTPSGSRPFAPVPITIPTPIPPSEDPDYVWDVFYHRPGLPDDYDAANVATLTGLPGNLAEGYSGSESEEEDEADEDSNAEEYYKNDYPDEESSDYDSSEGSDDAIYDDSDG